MVITRFHFYTLIYDATPHTPLRHPIALHLWLLLHLGHHLHLLPERISVSSVLCLYTHFAAVKVEQSIWNFRVSAGAKQLKYGN